MLLKIIFLFLLAYIMYNLFKQVFYIGGKRMNKMRGGNPRGRQTGEGVNRNRKNNQDKVIELDKDQYRIE